MTESATHNAYHCPVMLAESIDVLNLKEGAVCVDATFGGGSHSAEILARLNGSGHLYAFDHDSDALHNAASVPNLTLVRSNFRYLKNFMRYYNAIPVDAVLADLGVSSHHFDQPERGFSYRYPAAPLDMRMNQAAEKSAATVLNEYPETRLTQIFLHYGELKQSAKIAAAIVKARHNKPLETVADFLQTLRPYCSPANEKKFLACAFQAVRIEVNDELKSLEDFLLQAAEILKPGGRLAILSYHSLEDRLVKRFMKTGNCEGILHKDMYGAPLVPFRPVEKKARIAGSEEKKTNPRSHSAKLRAVEKI